MYLLASSPLEINVPCTTKNIVSKLMEEGKLKKCFEHAKTHVSQLLSERYREQKNEIFNNICNNVITKKEVDNILEIMKPYFPRDSTTDSIEVLVSELVYKFCENRLNKF